MAEKGEKLDFLTKLRIRELILTGLITITAVLANLPHEYVQETLGVSHNTLLAILAIAIIGVRLRPLISLLRDSNRDPGSIGTYSDPIYPQNS